MTTKKRQLRGLSKSKASSFSINRIAIHEVPVKAAAQQGGGPIYSEYLVPIDKALRTFFEDKLKATMGRQAQSVEESSHGGSKTPDLVRSITNDSKKDFLKQSQKIADQLYHAQNKTNSDGLLVVASGAITSSAGPVKAVAIMKLQKNEGANITRETKGGKTALAPQHIKDLMLSDETRVFKALIARQALDGTVEGLLSDEQTERGAENFRTRFLGLMLSRSPALLTQQFCEAVDEWITKETSRADEILRYRSALRVELDSYAKQLSPQNFIVNHIDTSKRSSIEDALKHNSIPLQAFEKDVSRLKPRHRRTKATTTRGIQIQGEATLVAELVESYTLDNGDAATLIRDVICK